MTGRAALAHELSCRWVSPLLDLVEAEGRTAGLDALLARWEVTRADLRDQSNWVSLRFCEDLIDWLGAEIGPDKLADEIARAMYSPRALGVMYPVFRAFGSPRVGYGALPQLIPRLNKVSAVSVSRVRRGAAEISLPTGGARAQGALAAHLPDAKGADRRRTDALELADGARRGDRVSGARRRGLPVQRPLGRATVDAGGAARSSDRRRDRSGPGARPLGGARRAAGRRRAGTNLRPARARARAADLRRGAHPGADRRARHHRAALRRAAEGQGRGRRAGRAADRRAPHRHREAGPHREAGGAGNAGGRAGARGAQSGQRHRQRPATGPSISERAARRSRLPDVGADRHRRRRSDCPPGR